MTIDLDLFEAEAKVFLISLTEIEQDRFNIRIDNLESILKSQLLLCEEVRSKEVERLALEELVRRLQKENEQIVDDALKCAAHCDEYQQRIRQRDEAIQEHIRTHDALLKEWNQMNEMMAKMRPVVEAAYYDYYSAFMIPGSGYSNKAQSLAARTWNCKFGNDSEFKKFLEALAIGTEGRPPKEGV